MNESPEVRAARGLEEFASAMDQLAPMHERCFETTQRDEELVSFTLDEYPFTLSWVEIDKPSIGHNVPVIMYSLCIWHTVGGGRWHPPETVDTTLIESQSVYDCIRVALETVAQEEIRLTMENYGYEQQAKEEATMEQM